MLAVYVVLCVLNSVMAAVAIWQTREGFRARRWHRAAWWLFLCALNGLAAGMTGAAVLGSVS